MLTLLSLLFYTALAAGTLALFGFLTGRFFQVETRQDAVVYCTTEDGWRIALSRYRPHTPIPGAPPVVLCPGYGLAGVCFDLTDEVSLARFLRDMGHDVWVLDLRGRGLSERPRLWGRRRYHWSFDDYVEFDLPAAIRTVLRETGAQRVQWVGHGLGALVVLAAAGTEPVSRVSSLVGVGAAAAFPGIGGVLSGPAGLGLRLLWSRSAVRVLAPLLGRVTPPPYRWLHNAENVDGPVLRRALVNGVTRLARPEAAQYASWLLRDRFEALEERIDYRKRLEDIHFPVLLVGGPHDLVARPGALLATLEHLPGTAPHARVTASRREGVSASYGHLDLLLGRNAPRDVYPWILTWLDGNAGVPLPDAPDRPGRSIPGVDLTAPERAELPPSTLEADAERGDDAADEGDDDPGKDPGEDPDDTSEIPVDLDADPEDDLDAEPAGERDPTGPAG